jgi:hypothetical protein
MRRWMFVFFCFFGAGLAQAQEAMYRFQALIDLDNSEFTGCYVDTAGGMLGGSEARVVALTDRARLQTVVLESCQNGAWQVERRDELNLALGLGQGISGSDAIEWTAPRAWFTAHPRIEVRMLAERIDAQVFDFIGSGSNANGMELDLVGTALPIPAVDALGMMLLGGAVFWLGRKRIAAATAQRAAALSMIATLLMMGPVQPIAVAVDGPTTRVTSEDPANDTLGTDAGADLLRADILADAERIHFRVDVRNIDEGTLPDGAKVLFIGNSLTYFNDLPLMLEAIAAQAGKTLDSDAITLGGASLEDHFRQRSAHATLARGGYRFVIMQQGPSSLLESQENLVEWTRRFDPLIRAGGAQPALYMVWPEFERLAYFDAVRESYSNAALAVQGMFIPAGEAWRAAWRVDPNLPLYGSDRFHPSPLGSYAAALSMFAELYQQSPVGLPARLQLSNGQNLQFNATQVLVLQEAAWSAHLQYGRPGE